MDSLVSGLFQSPLCLWDSPALVHMVAFIFFLFVAVWYSIYSSICRCYFNSLIFAKTSGLTFYSVKV